MMNLEFRV